jgi:hypothetical protein
MIVFASESFPASARIRASSARIRQWAAFLKTSLCPSAFIPLLSRCQLCIRIDPAKRDVREVGPQTPAGPRWPKREVTRFVPHFFGKSCNGLARPLSGVTATDFTLRSRLSRPLIRGEERA